MSQTEITEHNQDIESFPEDDDLRESTLDRRWEDVIGMYRKYRTACMTMISSRGGTALHVAVSDGERYFVKDLVEAIVNENEVKNQMKALEMTNEHGDTPLHLAASRGYIDMCKYIIGENGERLGLIKVKNNQGETPLFLAALTCQTQTFVYLSHISKKYINIEDLTRNDGDSILHCAIRRELLDLALIILSTYPKLDDIQNNETFSPLAVLATRPSAFRSGSTLNWWKKILYYYITVESLNPERATYSYLLEMGMDHLPQNYITCYHFFSGLRKLAVVFGFRSVGGKQKGSGEDEHKISIPLQNKVADRHVPPNYATCVQFVKFAYMLTLGTSGVGLNEIKKMKQKHKWADQLLSIFMKNPHQSYIGTAGRPDQSSLDDSVYAQFNKLDKDKQNETGRKETVFLVAARNGIVEIVNVLQSRVSTAIHDTTSDMKNVLLVAVENRHPLVVEKLRKRLKRDVWDNLIQGVDKQENTMLHLAAAGPSNASWQIPGAAMQMMWDIKWFQYIKGLLPDHFSFRNNKDEKTAWDIFKESHKQLVKDSSEWLKDTSESCSLVAALIAGVSFATSSTVPGGNNDNTGTPTLEGQPAFDTFAIASLIGLGFSVTALVMFLSILTSRKQAKDFRRDLPLKLVLGLSSLFVSIASMFVSFCAGHFFVLKDKYKQILFPVYVATCLPVSFYAVAQFPLYFDLLRVILTKVPQTRDTGDNL